MISKIIVPTLERIPGRRYANLGALLLQGTPIERIEYFPARDARDWIDNAPAAVATAIAEGFHINDECSHNYSRQNTLDALKWFCMRWTFTMCLKSIMNYPSNQYLMFLIDDFALNRPFNHFEQLLNLAIDDAKQHAEQVRLIQLDVRNRIDLQKEQRHPVPGIFTDILVRGLAGAGDAGFLLNSEGAAVLYHQMCRTGGRWNLEGQLWHIANHDDQSGFYATLHSGYWLRRLHIPELVPL